MLPALSFPAFGPNFESAEEYTFSITLSNEPFAKLHLWPNSPFGRRIRISRKSPMADKICRFARNRTDAKIIKIGLQSEFCKGSNEF